MQCKFGFHKWNNRCVCSVCGKTRNSHHTWNGCTCTVCKTVRDFRHDWNGCTCQICEKIRDEGHDLDGCFCHICQQEVHDWKLVNEEISVYKKSCGTKTKSGAVLTVKEVKKATWKCKRCAKIESTEEIISEKETGVLLQD